MAALQLHIFAITFKQILLHDDCNVCQMVENFGTQRGFRCTKLPNLPGITNQMWRRLNVSYFASTLTNLKNAIINEASFDYNRHN